MNDATPTSAPWKRWLLAFWAVALAVTIVEAVDYFGFGTHPWAGWWDIPFSAGEPFNLIAGRPVAGGAAERAGIREGDRFDLREQTLQARTALFGRMPTQPVRLLGHRERGTFSATVLAKTAGGGASPFDVLNGVLLLFTSVAYLSCALLIIVRCSWLREGRVLALVLISTTISGANFVAFPDARLSLLAAATVGAATWITPPLVVELAARFGTRHFWRSGLEWTAYALIGLIFLNAEAQVYGTLTLKIDPVSLAYGWWSSWLVVGGLAAVVAVVIAAIAVSPRDARPRAAWLLLPVPLAWVSGNIAYGLSSSTGSYLAASMLNLLGNAVFVTSSFVVTYAVINRRVLDFGFVLSRTIVVGIVSLIVVMAFVLLEWVLGSVLVGVSHATGLIANAGLALVLGVSLSVIHKRVDEFVDAVMFRKRREDERALLAFSKESAFVTEREALLDEAIEKLHQHTDARAVAVFVFENGSYKAVREFGDAPAQVGDNDPAILALKTWHKPIDPHHYATALRGDLALPMVSRGQLLGVVLCGERARGEAYAPDEVEALATFAHGVGSAFDGLQDGVAVAKGEELVIAMREVRDSVAALRDTIDRHFSS
jgi:hypothetical protein